VRYSSLNKRRLRYFDWLSFGLVLGLSLVGLLFIFSTTYTPEKPFSFFFKKQFFGLLSGCAIYFFCSFKERRTLLVWGYYGFLGMLVLLCYTIIGGWTGMGAKRWISLYFIRFQPSEVAKLCLPLFIALTLADQKKSQHLSWFKRFKIPLVAIGSTFFLVLRQPDLGTALLILMSGALMLWIAGLPNKFFVIVGLCMVSFAPFLWHGLRPYQQKRVLSLFGYGSVTNERYQIEQSKIAIGSGGLVGKGFLKGTQNRYSFLPEDHTDFIFSVICEEWGYAGAFLVLLLFITFFIRSLYLILSLSSKTEQLVAFGMIVHVILSVITNIGMATGLLPTVGVPLPLISYGLTYLWITLAGLGIIQNFVMTRFSY